MFEGTHNVISLHRCLRPLRSLVVAGAQASIPNSKESPARARARGLLGGSAEMIVVMATYVTMMGMLAPSVQLAQTLSMGAVAAWELRIIRDAAYAYIRDYWTTVYAWAATPQTLPISTLQTAGYLGNNFGSGNNPFNQSHVIVLAQAGVQQLTGAVLTTGGRALSVTTVDLVANWIGEYAGYVPYSTDPYTCSPSPCIKGVGMMWSLAMSAFTSLGVSVTPGHLASGIFFTQGMATSPFLSRYNTGDPDATTMHANANWNGNSLLNALNVNATTFGDATNPTTYYLTPAGTSNVVALTATGPIQADTVTAGTMMSSPAYYHVSDARLKDVDGPVQNACEKLAALDGVQFHWKDTPGSGGPAGEADMGLLAQEVAKVFPEAVGQLPNGYMAVKYDVLMAPMLECMKDKGVVK